MPRVGAAVTLAAITHGRSSSHTTDEHRTRGATTAARPARVGAGVVVGGAVPPTVGASVGPVGASVGAWVATSRIITSVTYVSGNAPVSSARARIAVASSPDDNDSARLAAKLAATAPAESSSTKCAATDR